MSDLSSILHDGYRRLDAFRKKVDENKNSKTKVHELVSAEKIYWVQFQADTSSRPSKAKTEREQLANYAQGVISEIEKKTSEKGKKKE